MEIVPIPTSAASILTEMKEISIDSKKFKIQVSNTKRPLFFYLNLAKKYIKMNNYVVLSALGMAIPTVITIAEILKSNGVALETKVLTSTVVNKDETNGRTIQKPKIEILMERCENWGGDGSESAKLDVADSEKTESSAKSMELDGAAAADSGTEEGGSSAARRGGEDGAKLDDADSETGSLKSSSNISSSNVSVITSEIVVESSSTDDKEKKKKN